MNLQEHVILKPYTTFRIGGSARYFVIAKTQEEIQEAVDFARKNELPVGLIGAGCNLIIRDDQEIQGVIIKIATQEVSIEGNRITAEAGVSFSALTAKAHQSGLVGLEWCPSVPASVGGAVRGNAGAFGGETKDLLVSVRVLRDGEVIDIPREEIEFDYRYSMFKHPDNTDIILAASFELSHGDVESARTQVRDFIQRKQQNQPVGVACSGCIFQNYDEGTIEDPTLIAQYPELNDFNAKGIIPSGYLIERAGLKGAKEGGAEVSMKHANYIINPNNDASFEDVQKLIHTIQQKVHTVFGVWIKEEAVYLDQYLRMR